MISFFSCSLKVSAQSATGVIRLEPAFQEITLTEKEATVSGEVKITNTSQKLQEFDLSAIEIQQFDANGSIVLSDKTQVKTDSQVADFITLPQTKVKVLPNSTTIVPILITNAQNLSPGGHYIALVARLADGSEKDQVVLPAISAFFLIRKTGGELYHLSLIDSNLQTSIWWQKLPTIISLRFTNQGNTHLIPRGIITVTDQFQRLVAKSVINENSLYVFPETERPILQKLETTQSLLPISLFQVEVIGTTQPGSIPFQEKNWIFFFNPLGFGLIFSIISFSIFFFRRGFQNYQKMKSSKKLNV